MQHVAPLAALNRRQFLLAAAGTAVAMSLPGFAGTAFAAAAPLALPPLPYAEGALAPVISANTVGFHYGKHHAGYVTTLNKLIAGTPYADMTLEEIVKTSAGKKEDAAIFNNAAQVWNHTFYWNSLSPKGGGTPPAALLARIKADFGDMQGLLTALGQASVGRFGSGWAWLYVTPGGDLEIGSTANQDSPLMGKAVAGIEGRPVIGVDVWEHAYYLDYQNRRADYVNALLDNLLNWDFAARNLAG